MTESLKQMFVALSESLYQRKLYGELFKVANENLGADFGVIWKRITEKVDQNKQKAIKIIYEDHQYSKRKFTRILRR